MEDRYYYSSEKKEKSFDSLDFLVYLVRRWYFFLIAMLLLGAVAGIANFLKADTYTSYASIFIQQDTKQNTNLADIQLSNALSDDFIELANSKTVMIAVSEAINQKFGTELTRDDVVDASKITNKNNTRLLVFTVTYRDAEIACEMAEQLAKITSEQVSKIMKTNAPAFVDHAEVEKANGKGFVKWVLLAMAAGFGIVLLMIPFWYFGSDVIVTRDDVEKYLGENILGMISLDKSILNRNQQLKKKESKPNFSVR